MAGQLGSAGIISATEALPAFNVLDLKLDVQDSTIVYAGTEGNGLYRSFNNGQNWEKVADRNNILSPALRFIKSFRIDLI